MFVLLRRIRISIDVMDKILFTGQILGAKTYKNCCHVSVLEVVVFWLLETTMKAQMTNFHSRPIKFLESFLLSTDHRGVKRSVNFLFSITK
jgi:hypothetical protein